MFVLIIDYGSGNIKSVYNSVKKTLNNYNISIDVKVSNNLLDIKKVKPISKKGKEPSYISSIGKVLFADSDSSFLGSNSTHFQPERNLGIDF